MLNLVKMEEMKSMVDRLALKDFCNGNLFTSTNFPFFPFFWETFINKSYLLLYNSSYRYCRDN